MRITTWTMLAAASSALSLSACTQPRAENPTLSSQTGGQQTAPDQGGVTFNTNQVGAPPVTAYTGSQRGSNSPLGVTYQDPSKAPGVGAYTGSQRGSNSPLGFQRNPSGSSTPVEQPVTPTQ